VLEPEIVAELETLLDAELGRSRMPDDPHAGEKSAEPSVVESSDLRNARGGVTP